MLLLCTLWVVSCCSFVDSFCHPCCFVEFAVTGNRSDLRIWVFFFKRPKVLGMWFKLIQTDSMEAGLSWLTLLDLTLVSVAKSSSQVSSFRMRSQWVRSNVCGVCRTLAQLQLWIAVVGCCASTTQTTRTVNITAQHACSCCTLLAFRMLSHEFGEVTVASDKRLQVESTCLCMSNPHRAECRCFEKSCAVQAAWDVISHASTGASKCFPATKKLLGAFKDLDLVPYGFWVACSGFEVLSTYCWRCGKTSHRNRIDVIWANESKRKQQKARSLTVKEHVL